MGKTTTQPNGNELLKLDLEALLKEANDNQFSDVANTNYAMPKTELLLKLNNLINSVKDGTYDD